MTGECAHLSVRHFLDTDAIFTSYLLGVQIVGKETTVQGELILKVGGPYNERSLPLVSVCKICEIRNCNTRESVEKT
jgi:short subunit dehydrogenase-like uncharacterized protein